MRPIIYQLVVRYFGNTNLTNHTNGDLRTNGTGKFADITDSALNELKDLGATHLWLTGVLRRRYHTVFLQAESLLLSGGTAASGPPLVQTMVMESTRCRF